MLPQFPWLLLLLLHAGRDPLGHMLQSWDTFGLLDTHSNIALFWRHATGSLSC